MVIAHLSGSREQSMKISIKMQRRFVKKTGGLAKFGLLIKQMALDWTLPRRQSKVLGVPLQPWEQHSRDEWIQDL